MKPSDLHYQFPMLPSAPGETANPDPGGAPLKSDALSSLQQGAPPGSAVPTPAASPGAPLPPEFAVRPRLRADCLAGLRPCPWIGCKWHLCWERRDLKRLILSDCHPSLVASAILNMGETCVLDVSETPRSDREVSAVLGVTHQAVAQACQRGLGKLKGKRLLKRGRDEVCGPEPGPAWRWGTAGGGGSSSGSGES